MYGIVNGIFARNFIVTIMLILTLNAFNGCDAPIKIFRVGIISSRQIDESQLQGFMNGMTESGYTENKNIKYIYTGEIGINQMVIDAEINKMKTENVDLIITFGEGVTLRAKELLKGTDMPVVFGTEPWPVEDGLVESLSHPGGNLTGITLADSIPKALEWLVKITPNAKKVYVPYNPDDYFSATGISRVKKSAASLGINPVLGEVRSVEEAVKNIENLPKDIDAVFLIPSPTLTPRSKELSQAAIVRKVPIGSSLFSDELVLIKLASDFFDTGKKISKIANNILQGIKPADIPVEATEVSLVINVNTAEKIGLNIPDDILAQAKTIIRY
jgi:putative tryptophan/tyrosine transport system substrate-binding protein